MKIVIDSNIIFSALISGKEIYLDIFKMNDIYEQKEALIIDK